MGVGAAHQEADTPAIADHHSPDFQQHEPNAVRTRLGQGCPFQGFATQPFEQGIRQTGQQLPELIRPPALAGRAVGKQVQRLAPTR